jgi:hypothetical protein
MDSITVAPDPPQCNGISPDAENLTWEQLTELEPRLLRLYERARAFKDNRRSRSFCANAVWYGRGSHEGLKSELCALVGWAVRRLGSDLRLATPQAYSLAYSRIYDALPNCRKCACFGFQDIVDARLGRGRARSSK